jgi:hypothetical protein
MHVVVTEKMVFHYGELATLSPLAGRTWLYEGDTLSVSLCPREWLDLAPSGPPAALYALGRSDGQDGAFVDLSRLSSLNRMDVETWGKGQGLGILANPDLAALRALHDAWISEEHGERAYLIAWAKRLDMDGIWFSDPISAPFPDSSRGGIFQHRLQFFRHCRVADLNALASWPTSRPPNIRFV